MKSPRRNQATKNTQGAYLKAALEYLDKGWVPIPLCWPGEDGRCACGGGHTGKLVGKAPLVSWKEYQSNRPKRRLIRSWWKQWPNANIGIVTGRISGLVVLDVDPRHGGEAALTSLQEQYGQIPETLESQTGGGGLHIFFAHPGPRITSKIGTLGKGLDLKADGGYVVAPPSRHVSGRQYQWKARASLDELSLAPLPLSVLGRIRESDSPSAGRVQAVIEQPTVITIIPAGQRNSTLTSLAGTMRRRGMTEDAIRSALLAENEARCQPPLPEEEVEQIARSVGKYRPAAPGENLTDVGNARRLVAMHGQDVRYCPPLGKWLVWDGKRWAVDETGGIVRRAKVTVTAMYKEAARIMDSNDRKELAKHAARSESEARINAMISLAMSEPNIPVTPDQLDRNPWILAVQNGTVDLRTGQLLSPRREDLITKLAPVEYDAEARCPTWERFLKEIMEGDQELVRFLQKAIGYSLTGSTSEQCLFILYGTGANGKSTLLSTLRSLLGDYARQTPTDTLLVKRGNTIPNDIARLRGARLVSAVEAEDGRRLAEALVKQLTGGDTITARFLHREFFEFETTFKIFLAVNHKPIIQGTDYAIWRRIRLIPFNVAIPEQEQDKGLPEKLRKELPGILRWAVEGCIGWQKEGLDVPAAVKRATATYREEMDVIASFIKEWCVVNEEERETAANLYEAYVKWCEEAGEQPLSKSQFGVRLTEKGFKRKRSKRERYYLGIALR